MAVKIISLEKGVELWKAKPTELKEQDLNARYMPPAMFDRLVKNISADKRLESLPFCALVSIPDKTDEEGNQATRIEIISGHHRVRAASKAGLEEIFIIVDTTNMPLSKRRSKQLSHNSIAGTDDKEILKKLYEDIDAAEDRLSAYITFDDLADKTAPLIASMNEKMIYAVFMFSEYTKERLEKVYETLAEKDFNMIAKIKYFEDIQKKFLAGQKGYNIRSAGVFMSKLLDLAMIDLGLEEPYNITGMASLLDVLGMCLIPDEYREPIKKKMDKLAKKYPKPERYKALLELLGVDVDNASGI